ncbi:MAG TPA: chemotaxis protein CheW [Longimicrobiales bacterium]|nr:chemotaxis protein CheW [Longimicrobiales bacterium]
MAERGAGGRGEEAMEALVRLPGRDAVLAVLVAGDEYGLPVARVGEVLRVPTLTRVPVADPEIRGVVSIRGEVVTVVDMGVRLRAIAVDETLPAARLVTVTAGEPLALLVDGVVGLVDLRGTAMEPAPAEAEAGLPPGLVRGIVALEEGRRVALLDLERVVQPGEPENGSGR